MNASSTTSRTQCADPTMVPIATASVASREPQSRVGDLLHERFELSDDAEIERAVDEGVDYFGARGRADREAMETRA